MDHVAIADEIFTHSIRLPGVGLAFEEPRYAWNARLDQIMRVFDAVLILTLPDGVGREKLSYPHAPLYWPGMPAFDGATKLIARRHNV